MSDTPEKHVPFAEYWLNEERLSNDGKYIMYRNYSNKSGRLMYKTHAYINSDTRTHINDSCPVAVGFTAYAIEMGLHTRIRLKERISRTYRYDLYEKYFRHQLDYTREYGTYEGHSFQDTKDEDLENKFIPIHIEVEKGFIKKCDAFFSASFKGEKKSVKQQVFQYAEGYLNFVNNLPEAASCPKGLGGHLNREQLFKLYTHLKGERSIKARREDFESVFSDLPLSRNFQKIQWISKNQHNKPNEYHLRALLEVCGVKVDGKKVKKMDVSHCFADSKGRPIALGNPKRDIYFERHKIMLLNLLE